MVPRTLGQALHNAERLRRALPYLIQPSNSDKDIVLLKNEIDRMTAIINRADISRNLSTIMHTARQELANEQFREMVEDAKVKMRARRPWIKKLLRRFQSWL